MATSSTLDEESKVVNVRKFLEQWGDQINYPTESSSNVDEAIATKMNVSMETVQELSEFCSPASLWCGSETIDKKTILETIPDDVDLKTVKNQTEELDLRKKNSTYSNHIMRKMKYNYNDWYRYFQPDEKKKDKSATRDDSLLKKANIVLSVDVHRPYHGKAAARMVISETYLVLGTNKLTDLRDVIKCANDYAVSGDLSLTPDITELTCAKDIFMSGCFFIEGTFYDDMRHSDNREYSQTILSWIGEGTRSERIGTFKKAQMEDTTFLDLNLVVGKPYYYQHQGDCEHLLIFSDLRMLHPMDPHHMSSYPFLVRAVTHRRKLCKICAMNTAKWIVYKSPLIPTNPAFLCHRCFKALLYDEDGNKIGNFEAFRSSEHPT